MYRFPVGEMSDFFRLPTVEAIRRKSSPCAVGPGFTDPEMICQVADDVPAHFGKASHEYPLGKGSVDFPRYLPTLDEIGYCGFLMAERECGDAPVKDIGDSVRYLKSLMRQ